MKIMKPYEIEQRSFSIITQELGDFPCTLEEAAILKRVIHTTADFDYAKNLCCSPTAIAAGMHAIKNGCTIVTDTNMALSGINKAALAESGSHGYCFMADDAIAAKAKDLGCTRATLCMDKAATLSAQLILAVGNAPTALIRLNQLIIEGKITPSLIIAVPVGFVNVVESKELICRCGIPTIVAKGRKGGSNVAAAIINALLYLSFPRDCQA